jgi:hypothetical protein
MFYTFSIINNDVPLEKHNKPPKLLLYYHIVIAIKLHCKHAIKTPDRFHLLDNNK